jgi:hypothetical protein
MPNFKTCVNGHNYDADQYTQCPFCPVSGSTTDYEKTLMDFKSTQIFDEGNGQQFRSTQLNEETHDFKTTPVLGAAAAENHPFKRTSIGVEENGGTANVIPQTLQRKLVGWLVTFSNSNYGQDYKLFVGKNKIGSSADMDIVIHDPAVSAEHTTILFRDNDFLIKDNFSTNGTKKT